MHKKALYILFLLFSFGIFSQENRDTILLQNGKEFPCNITETDDFRIDYFSFTKSGKKKLGYIEKYRAFSYQKHNGSSSIMYEYDTLSGNFFTVPEMRNFVYGERDARANYKDHIWLAAMSFALSYGAVLFDTYLTKNAANQINTDNPDLHVEAGFFGSTPSFFPLFVPVVLTAVIGIPRFKIRRNQVGNKELYEDPHFRYGYHRISRQKRLFWQIGGGFGGFGLGLLSYYLFKKN